VSLIVVHIVLIKWFTWRSARCTNPTHKQICVCCNTIFKLCYWYTQMLQNWSKKHFEKSVVNDFWLSWGCSKHLFL